MSTLTFRPFPTRTGSKSARPRTLKRTAPVCYHLVWVAPLILLILGICMLLSISVTGQVSSGSGATKNGAYSGVAQQGTVAAIGLVLVLVLSRLDYRKLRKLSLLLLGLVAASLILVHIPGLGHKVRGATSYIGIGPFSIQPSEYAKLALVLAGAHLMSPPQMKDRSLRSFMLPFGAIGLVLCALVAAENDFGSAFIMLGLLLGMMWLGGMKSRQWLAMTGGGLVAGGGLMLAIAHDKFFSRIGAWADPWGTSTEGGYQLTQALLALGRGGWFGVGPGRSVQKFNYLPEAHNDMIYAILGEEFGFMGAASVIVLFGAFAMACWRLARRCSDPMGKYLIAGCGMIITLQAAVNIGGVVGAIPLTGVPLPFVSYGCNSLLVMLVAVGLILGVARRASAVAVASPAKRKEDVKRTDSGRWDGRARGARSSAR